MTLRVGLIGAGNMAVTHAMGWAAAGDEVVSVLATGSKRAPQLAVDLGAEPVMDLLAFLRGVDVVDVCSPTDTHLDYVLAAANAGKAVVCEKPLARTGPDAARAVAACEAAGVPLLVGHVVRFFPEYRTARERVLAGDIGQIAVMRLDRSTYVPATEGSWFGDVDRSGGVVLDLMIHDVDYARWVAGDVVRVYARSSQSADRSGHVLAMLRHASGALTHVQGSWAFPKGSFRTSLEIAGSEGLISLLAGEPLRHTVALATGVPDVPEPPTTLAESPYVTQLRHFSDVLHLGAAPLVSATDAMTAVSVCDALAESIESGLAVELETAQ